MDVGAGRLSITVQSEGNSGHSHPPPPCPDREMSGKLSCRCTPQRAQVSAGVGKSPHRLGGCTWMHPVNGTGNSPSPGQPTLE